MEGPSHTDKSYSRDNRLDVDSSHPGAGAGPKGMAVRHLKRYVSWVNNVVRQLGPYLLWALDI